MNRKIIKSILRKRVNDWLTTITDEKVRDLAAKNTIITGGSIVSLLLKEEVKDYDIYFRTKQAVSAIAGYYVAQFISAHPGINAQVIEHGENDPMGFEAGRVEVFIKSRGVAGEIKEDSLPSDDCFDVLDKEKTEDKEKPKYRPVFLSSNAITLADKIQLVVRFYGEPEEIHKNYDFVHCTNYWTSWDDMLTLRPEALEAILTRELKYVGSKYPVCSVIRTRKFLKRGWHINAGQYLKMLFQVSQLKLTDLAVLRDQLVGVDSAYFAILVDALESKKNTNPDFILTDGYLAEIIDRIF